MVRRATKEAWALASSLPLYVGWSCEPLYSVVTSVFVVIRSRRPSFTGIALFWFQSPGAKLIIRNLSSFVKAIWLLCANSISILLEQFRSLRDRYFPARYV